MSVAVYRTCELDGSRGSIPNTCGTSVPSSVGTSLPIDLMANRQASTAVQLPGSSGFAREANVANCMDG